MRVRVRLFAILRERAGEDWIELDLADGATVADAMGALCDRPPLCDVLGRLSVHMAVNREYANAQTKLAPGDELALIPPLSGGSEAADAAAEGGADAAAEGVEDAAGAASDATEERGEPIHVRIADEGLSLDALSRAVADPGAGAIVIFQGVTREVSWLEYETYREMAERRLEDIARDCMRRHGAKAVAVEHRAGSVPLGEPSVIVAVSAAHRSEAFAAAREAIDRVKAEAPIWKREIGADGSARWAEGTPAPGYCEGRGDDAGGLPPMADGGDATALTHLDEHGRARMVDVGEKPVSKRVARARARVTMSPASAAAIEAGNAPKGDVLATARLAGIQAAKQTGHTIPLAHPIELTLIDVSAKVSAADGLVELSSEVHAIARTGVEMEALTACAVAALTVYDMIKGIERGVEIERVVLLEKTGGRHDWRRDDDGMGG